MLGVMAALSGAARIYAQTLPQGFRGVRLGMTVDEVKEELKKDPPYGYNGDRDVSLLPGENRVLIETDSSRIFPGSFLDRCYFQFYQDKLYIITINMNRSKMDYHSVFSALLDKYGNPDSLNPRKSEWQDDAVIMALERPLTLKYTDRAVFEKLMEESMVQKSADELTRESFLEGL